MHATGNEAAGRLRSLLRTYTDAVSKEHVYDLHLSLNISRQGLQCSVCFFSATAVPAVLQVPKVLQCSGHTQQLASTARRKLL